MRVLTRVLTALFLFLAFQGWDLRPRAAGTALNLAFLMEDLILRDQFMARTSASREHGFTTASLMAFVIRKAPDMAITPVSREDGFSIRRSSAKLSSALALSGARKAFALQASKGFLSRSPRCDRQREGS